MRRGRAGTLAVAFRGVTAPSNHLEHPHSTSATRTYVERKEKKRPLQMYNKDGYMQSKAVRVQAIVLFLLILANFIAQVPYFLRLYYRPWMNFLAEARPFLLMGFVFAVFLV